MMDILLSAQDIAFDAGTVMADVNSGNIVKIIRNFVGPIALLHREPVSTHIPYFVEK